MGRNSQPQLSDGGIQARPKAARTRSRLAHLGAVLRTADGSGGGAAQRHDDVSSGARSSSCSPSRPCAAALQPQRPAPRPPAPGGRNSRRPISPLRPSQSQSQSQLELRLKQALPAMYGASDPTASERTAFRRAEKQYKLYKPLNLKGRSRSRSKPSSGEEGGTDLSAVVDFHALLAAEGELPAGIVRRDCAGFDRPVFCFLDRPGFYFIPGALSTEEQCCWIRESLKTFPQPPNRTNLTAIYGSISDLLIAAKNQKILVEVENPDIQERNEQNNCGGKTESKYFKFVEDSESQKGEERRSTAATTLVRKLRWSTLGLQFDWSKRNYDVLLPHNKIPDALASLAKKMAIPAMPSGEEFKAEAAIVNYYGPSDMLGGHVDDMEADWTKPIVSISLGCKCIFLLGGKTRDEVPTAMFLRSGDIVLMAGEARERFHGVPRIFTESDQQEISALISQLSSGDDVFILDYIRNSRININIRQVY